MQARAAIATAAAEQGQELSPRFTSLAELFRRVVRHTHLSGTSNTGPRLGVTESNGVSQEAEKTRLGIVDYAISQTSLEQIFNELAATR